jgi:5'-nucleotidase
MSFPIEDKLVIGIASSALFDLTQSNKIYEEQGTEAYRQYQEAHQNDPLPKGVAFSFIDNLLQMNVVFQEQQPVEVVLFSRNSPETGERVFHSIDYYNLPIKRAVFMSGESPFAYLPAFNVALFLSSNEQDVKKAINAGYPAGIVLPATPNDDQNHTQLRIAFDFDCVIADDESETVFKQQSLAAFEAHEVKNAQQPHNPGPLSEFFKKIGQLQSLAKSMNKKYLIRIAIVTARAAPSHQRVITTLKTWGITPDETFFLGGIKKERVLSIMKPHLFFDDQLSNLTNTDCNLAMVHVPFGVSNE